MRFFSIIVFSCFFLPVFCCAKDFENNQEQLYNEDFLYSDSVKLLILNKMLAKHEELLLKEGNSTYYNNLEMSLYQSFRSSNNKGTVALIRVVEHKLDEEPEIIFQGWLFSSMPSISTITHPIYEIILLE